MPEPWANYGIDLHLELARDSQVRAALEAALKDAARPAGSRRRAAVLPGPGRRPGHRAQHRRRRLRRSWSPRAGWRPGPARARGSPSARATAQPRPWPARGSAARPRYRPAPGVPPCRRSRAGPGWPPPGTALAAADDSVLGYPDPRGLAELRARWPEYLGRARGVVASPGERDHLRRLRAWAGPGLPGPRRRGGTASSPPRRDGHQFHRRIVAAQGLRVASLRSTRRRGAGAGRLEPAGGAVVLTPAHQYPLGMTLAPVAAPRSSAGRRAPAA